MSEGFRRIHHPPAGAAWNMAVDEALLESCIAGNPGFPCVRFYGWDPPALSLGFHQRVEAAADRSALRAAGFDLVRRPTGGRAVLHQHELTYSVIGTSRTGPLAGPVMTAYRRISEALVAGLRRLPIGAHLSPGDPQAGRSLTEPCFSRLSACEIAADGAKLAGSVQLQRRGCLLQHGSIVLRFEPGQVERCTGGRLAGEVRGVEDLAGRPVSPAELAAALAEGFAERFALPVVPGGLSAGERARAEALAEDRYRRAEWNLFRQRRRHPVGAVA